MKKKTVALVLAMALVFALAVGGTIAYLTDKTQTIENTFTVGNVNIELKETFNTDADKDGKLDSWTAQLIPGKSYVKDPTVSVKEGSEDCYLFVKFDELGDAAKYIQYTSNLNEENYWYQDERLPDNVWYRQVAKTDTIRSFGLLADKTVTINGTTVTSATMDLAKEAKLVYTAYACQSYGLDVVQAWNEVKPA